MKNILYLMHVHWGWIKQRPHFIAEYLSLDNDYAVTAFCESSYKNDVLTNNQVPTSLKLNELSRLPFGRFRIIRWLNVQFYRFQIRKSIANADIIWITYPYLFNWVEGMISDRVQLVYDCMDDALEAPLVKNDQGKRTALNILERRILQRANLVIASSDNLKSKLIERYMLNPDSISVVNNAVNVKPINDREFLKSDAFILLEKAIANTTQIKIMYLGTVSNWIDFELIYKSLKNFPEIVYIFIGPKEFTPTPHDRLIFIPPIPHDEVSNAMAYADALIMPFEISDFIKGVNPVKVYEYIYSHKPTIVVGYPETEKFSDYVYLYHNENELFYILKMLIEKKLLNNISDEERLVFISKNTWLARTRSIKILING